MPQKPGGRPRKPIPETTLKIIVGLVASGDSDNRVYKITGIQPREWHRVAKDAEAAIANGATPEKSAREFAVQLRQAEAQRAGGLAATLRSTMMTMIRKGHPWWAKLALHNYATGLRDPDVASAGKLRKLIAKSKAEGAMGAQDLVIKFRPLPVQPSSPPSAEAKDL